MNYTLVYRDDPQGFNWTIMNSHGLYAAWVRNFGRPIRKWPNSVLATEYMDRYVLPGRAPVDLVWAPWPTDKPTPIKPVTTAASYKPVHGGYSQPTTVAASTQAERQVPLSPESRRALDALKAARIASMTPAEQGTRKESSRRLSQPLVWPVIPERDDGSNEEASTVPDSLVAELSKSRFVIVIRR